MKTIKYVQKPINRKQEFEYIIKDGKFNLKQA
jgi:hypothetical protein